jgi:hypothetical protein
VAHPRALVVFGTVDGALTRLEPSGATTFSPCGPGVNVGFQLSGDGEKIFSVCPNGHFVTVNSATGAIVADSAIARCERGHW